MAKGRVKESVFDPESSGAAKALWYPPDVCTGLGVRELNPKCEFVGAYQVKEM